jgi:hypothetical protein
MFGITKLFEHHLNECRDRYVALNASLTALDKKIDATRESADRGFNHIYGLLWALAGTTVVMLLVAVATLLLKLIHP